MGHPFSSLNRSQIKIEISKETFDLLIIGGGITGAGIALDAQVRGLKTGLIEMQDFAAGTSSRSTKLVHGGLRYLKQFNVRLVSEVSKERTIVYENAPHVTTPIRMLLPITKNGTFSRWSTSVGLTIYDTLANVKNNEKHVILNKYETIKIEPLLNRDDLKGSGSYVEYQTDDARLTIEIVKEAVARGAIAINYMKAKEFIYEQNKIVGVKAVDEITKDEITIFAKKIVNASGPWVDMLREKDRSKLGKHLYVTKGIHIVFDQTRLPLQQAIYFDTGFDNRMCFAIPRDGKTYVGTTDTFYDEDYVNPRVTKEDVHYLLNAINHAFPFINVTIEDIETCWAGLRPLIHEQGKKPSEISRKDERMISNSGLISIAGGKLTGYRKMAEKIVNIVCKDLDVDSQCITEGIKLSGGKFSDSSKFKPFISIKIEEGKSLGLSTIQAEKLVKTYGENVEKIFSIIKRGYPEKFYLSKEVYGSLVYGIEEEMVTTPIDYFLRRTSAMLFDLPWVQQWKHAVVEYMGYHLNWSQAYTNLQLQKLEEEIKIVTTIAEK